MITEFIDYKDLPLNFKGYCYVINDHTHYWFGEGLKLHNIKEPAVIRDNGTKKWCVNGKYHRLDGPAVMLFQGETQFWIDGRNFSQENYWKHPMVIKNKLELILQKETFEEL